MASKDSAPAQHRGAVPSLAGPAGASTGYLSATPPFVWCLHFSVPYAEHESPVRFEDYCRFFRVEPGVDYAEYALLAEASRQRSRLAEILRRASPAGTNCSFCSSGSGSFSRRNAMHPSRGRALSESVSMHDSNSQSAAGKVEISSASRRSIPNVASASVGTEENVNFASTGSATLSSNSLSRTYSVDSNGDRFSGLNDLSINSTANGEAGAANTTGAASVVNSQRWTYDEVLEALQAYEETLLEVFGLLVDGEMLDSGTFGSDTGNDDSSGSDSERDSNDGESEGETMGLVRQPGFAWSSTLDSDVSKRWVGDICLEIVAVLSNRAVCLVRKATIGPQRLGKNEAKLLREAAGIYDWLGGAKLSARAGLPEASPQVVYALSAACRATAQQVGVIIGQRSQSPPHKLLASLCIGIAHLFTQSLATLRSASDSVQVHRNLPKALACWPYIWRAAAFAQLAQLERRNARQQNKRKKLPRQTYPAPNMFGETASSTGLHSHYNRLLVLAKAELDNLPRAPLLLICDQFTIGCVRREQDRIEDILSQDRKLCRLTQQLISQQSQVGDTILPRPKWMASAAAIQFSPVSFKNEPLTGLGAYSIDTLQIAARAAVKYDRALSHSIAYKMYGHAITMLSLIIWHAHVRAVALGHGGQWEGNSEDKLMQRITSYLTRQEALLNHLKQGDALAAAKLAGERSSSRSTSKQAAEEEAVDVTRADAGTKATRTAAAVHTSRADSGVGHDHRKRTNSSILRSFIAVPEDAEESSDKKEQVQRGRQHSGAGATAIDAQEVSKPGVVNITSSSLTLHWTLKGGRKTRTPVFQVEWRRRSTQDPNKWCKWRAESTLVVGVNNSTGLYTKHGLRASMAYQFRICVHGARGKKNSEWSEPSNVAETEADDNMDPFTRAAASLRLQARRRSISEFSMDLSVAAVSMGSRGRKTLQSKRELGPSPLRLKPSAEAAPAATAAATSVTTAVSSVVAGTDAVSSARDQSNYLTNTPATPARPDPLPPTEDSMSTTADEEPPRLSSMLRAPSVDDAGHLLDQVAAADVVYDDPPLVLGQGGFGIVMRSAIDGYNHRGDQITVAIKRVRPSRSGRPDVNESEQMEIMESMVEELHAEASMLAKLRHANIVSVLAINLSPEEGPFLVMQFCNHGTLKEALHPKRRISSAERRAAKGTTPKTRKGRCMLTLQARLVLAEQIASAVAYLHARDPLIIHRDLKPANVLLMRVESPNDVDGGVVRGVGPSNQRGLHRRTASAGAAVEGQDFQVVAMLTDFGLSRSRERHGAAVNTVLGGSYPYLAPEAFRHNAITEAVDIYSFGIMLLEIATLDAPWSGMAPYQITMEVAVEKKRPRVPITAKIPQGVFSLVRDCWSHEQSDRPAAMEVEMRMANILQTLPQEESDLPSADFSSSLKE